MDEVEDFYSELNETECALCGQLFPALHSYYSEINMDKNFWAEKIKENKERKENEENDENDEDIIARARYHQEDQFE